MKRWTPLIAGAVLLVACSGGSDEKAQSQPTATPAAPTPTATPTMTPAQQFATDANALITKAQEEITRIAGLAASANTRSDSWRMLYQQAIDRLGALSEETPKLTAPECLRPARDELVKAGTEYQKTVATAKAALAATGSTGSFSAVDFLVQSSIKEGTLHLNEAARLLKEAKC